MARSCETRRKPRADMRAYNHSTISQNKQSAIS